MSNNSKSVPAVSSVEGAGRVVDGGDVSSEGLGLGGGPVLTLERLGHGLVGHLASSTVDRGGVDSSVDHRSGNGMSSVDHRGSMDDRAGDSMDNGAGDSDGVGNRDSLGVDSLAIVGDGGDVSLDVVGGVLDVLGAAVREGDGVRSSPGSGAIVGLSSLEVGAGVVVGNGVLVLVGGDLVGVHLSDGVGNGVGNSVVDNRGGVDDWGSMGNKGGSVDNRAGNSVGNRVGNAVSNNTVGKSVADNSVGKSVTNNTVGKSVSNNTVGKSVTNNSVGKSVTNNSVGNTSNNSSLSKVASEARLGSVAHRVRGSDGGDGGTEALGLAGSPDLTLEGLGH